MSERNKQLESEDPVIKIENLSFKYPMGDGFALEDINFSVKQGEFLGILGPSGAGKTTLCMILKGLIPYTVTGKLTGKEYFENVQLNKENLHELTRRASFVFQDPEMQIIGLTIEEDLVFGPENYEWEREKICKAIPDMLNIVRMDDYERRETWSLSGVQKQRVSIVSALILEPDILILDEPSSELDPVGKMEVYETIRRLKQEYNMTVLVVEHEIEELAEIADRIILMNEGKIIDQGTPEELFRKVDLFRQIGGERVPQIAEVLAEQQSMNYLAAGQFAVTEEEGVKILMELLERNR